MAVAHVQSKTAGANASTTPQVVLDAAPTKDNLLFAAVALGNTSGGFTAINGYTAVAGPNSQVNYFYKLAGASESATQAPCTTGTARDYICSVSEYSGVALSSPLNVSGSNTDATSPQDLSSAINPTDNIDTLMIGVASNDVARTYSGQTIGGTAANERTDASQNANASVSVFDRLNVNTSTSTFVCQATASGVPTNGAIALFIFKLLTMATLTGTVTPTGTLTKTPMLVRSGTVTPAGTLTKLLKLIRTGSVTPTGALTKKIVKTFAGSVTPTGAIAATRVIVVLLTGLVTPTGIIKRLPMLVRSGTVTPTGALTKRLSILRGGTVTPSGILRKLPKITLSGTVTPSGTLSGLLIGAIRNAYKGGFAQAKRLSRGRGWW